MKRAAKHLRRRRGLLSEFEYLFPPATVRPAPNETGVLPALGFPKTSRRFTDRLEREE